MSIQGSPIVHCHDGGGRSGAFLAVEANLSLLERKELIDGKKRLYYFISVNTYTICSPGYTVVMI